MNLREGKNRANIKKYDPNDKRKPIVPPPSPTKIVSETGELENKKEIDDFINKKYNLEGLKEGVKFDSEKTRFDLVPPDAYEAAARVMTDGAKKYADHNWTKLKLVRVLTALKRHLNKFDQGEEFPKDSREHHMAHVIANAMMAYHLIFNHPEADDRFFKNVETEKNRRSYTDES